MYYQASVSFVIFGARNINLVTDMTVRPLNAVFVAQRVGADVKLIQAADSNRPISKHLEPFLNAGLLATDMGHRKSAAWVKNPSAPTRIPMNADQDQIDRKAHSSEVEHIDSFWRSGAALYLIGPSTFANATEPH